VNSDALFCFENVDKRRNCSVDIFILHVKFIIRVRAVNVNFAALSIALMAVRMFNRCLVASSISVAARELK